MKAVRTTKLDETPEFVEFWTVWQPHMHPNDGRGDARNCFFQHVRHLGAAPKDIADGGKWYIRNRKADQWMPHAATWINKGAYEDFAAKERAMRATEAERAAQASQAPTNVQQLRPEGYKTPFLKAYEAKQAAGN